jgi:ABC-2 type transport system ATP-binding protein
MNAIEVNNLKKSFGEQRAVDGITFSVEQGEIFSLLGPNGAGKSTTISMLCGLLAPGDGDAAIMGHSIRSEAEAAKASLGVVPQDIALYPDLSARENLDFWGKMYGLRSAVLQKRVAEVLDIIGLADRQNDRVGTFSGGMKRRVNIGAALLHKPEVVIMDEPTVGIDPQSRRHILENVKDLNRQGMTVLYTTHYMEEAAELSRSNVGNAMAFHIAIMDKGKVIANGTHDELIRMVGEETRIDLTINDEPSSSPRLLEDGRSLEGVAKIDSTDGNICALVHDSNLVLPQLFEAAARAGTRITSVNIQEPNLETVFLHLTGRALRD